jgi:hypothetical protein
MVSFCKFRSCLDVRVHVSYRLLCSAGVGVLERSGENLRARRRLAGERAPQTVGRSDLKSYKVCQIIMCAGRQP